MIDIDINFKTRREPEKLDNIYNMSARNKSQPQKIRKKIIHSSAAIYGSDKKDFMFAVIENVYYVNFLLHAKFINRSNQLQTNEQSLPAWLAD